MKKMIIVSDCNSCPHSKLYTDKGEWKLLCWYAATRIDNPDEIPDDCLLEDAPQDEGDL